MNRPSFVERLIRYYVAMKFKGRLIIGDGSEEGNFSQTQAICSEFSSNLNIRHLHLPGCSVAEAVREANSVINTKYICLVGDDDFIVPSSAANCIEFLEDNPDYVAAHGVGILLSGSDQNPSKVNNVSYYEQPQIVDDTVAQRVSSHLKNYSVTLFSVHRKESWSSMFEDSAPPYRSQFCRDKTFSAELLPCCLSVAAGKVAQIEGLYLVRQNHDDRYHLPTWLDWILNEHWSTSYLYFREKLSRVIIDVDGLDENSAFKVVDNAFSYYFEHQLCNSSVPKVVHFRNYLGSFSYLKWLARCYRRLFSFTTNTLTLRKLLSKSSPYHDEFLPIYNSIRSMRLKDKSDY